MVEDTVGKINKQRSMRTGCFEHILIQIVLPLIQYEICRIKIKTTFHNTVYFHSACALRMFNASRKKGNSDQLPTFLKTPQAYEMIKLYVH